MLLNFFKIREVSGFRKSGHIYAQIHTHVHTCKHAHMRTCMLTLTCTHAHTCIRTYKHTCDMLVERHRHVATVYVMIVNCWTSHGRTTFRSVCADLPQVNLSGGRSAQTDRNVVIKFSCRVKSKQLTIKHTRTHMHTPHTHSHS